MKNKLYVRNYDETDRPFAIYDIRSLEIKDDEDFAKKLVKCARKEDQPWNDKVLERTNLNTLDEIIQRNELESYRRLVKTPLFSDGESLYVVSIYRINPNQGSTENECEVEIYDPETWACTGSIRLIMDPEEQKDWTNEQATKINEQTDHVKQYLDTDHLHEHVFATNGQQLVVNIQEKLYFFDLKTGRRSAETLDVPCKLYGYDFHTNTFWFYKPDTDKLVLKSLKLNGFKSKKEMEDEYNLDFSQFLKARTQTTLEEQKNPDKTPARSIESILRSLGNKPEEKVDYTKTKHNKDISQSLYLIMYTMNKGCEDIDSVIQQMDALYPDLVQEKLKLQTQLFRSSYAITISNNYITEVANTLEYFCGFVGENMTDDNLLEQYQFLWISKIVNRLILCLEKCKLKLNQVVQDNDTSSQLVEMITKLCSKIADPGFDRSQLQASNNKDEVEALWHECEIEWRAIQNVLINIASESSDDLAAKIDTLVKALTENNVQPSDRMFLQYLSEEESIKKIFEDSDAEMHNKIFSVFEVLCDRKAQRLVDSISSLSLISKNEELKYTDLELISDEFIYIFSNRVLIYVFSIYANISKAIENDQKKKIENLKLKAEENMKLYSRAYNKITSSSKKVFDAATGATAKVVAEVEAQNLEDEKVKETTKTNYKNYHECLFTLAKENNKFLDFVHIYVACYSSDKDHKMTKDLNNMCKMTIELLNSFSHYCETESKKLELEKEDNILKFNLSEDLMKFLIWSLSKIAHSFIKIKPSEKKEDDSTNESLLKSKLLSGGIENRFLSTFSKDTCQTIENLAAITDDNKLIQYLSKAEKIDEDEIYEAIIHHGRDESVDKLIDLLQWNLERKNPASKVGGEDGMTVSRCAFAGMLALNQHDDTCNYTNFVMMIDQLEMSMDTVEGENKNQINKALMEELKELETIDSILDRWAMASRMRIWLQEKKKDISNSVKKKAEAEQKRKEEEQRILMEENEKKEEEEKDHKSNDDEETIDTTKEKKFTVPPIDESDLRRKENEQIKIIVKKVAEKAELLVKL